MDREVSSSNLSRSRSRMKNSVGSERMRKPMATWKKWLIFAVAEILTLSLIFSYAYVLRQYNKIQRLEFNEEEVKNTDISVETIKKMEGYRTIAIFGVDSRNSAVGKGNNSDVIIIASINLANSEVRLASIYRDSYLNLGNERFNKINQAYAIGGPEQALKAINKNLDLNITEYVTFNWKAVATGINILGGVDVEITKPEFRYINSYITETVKSTNIGSKHLTKTGMQHLDGIQAVAYARLRYMDSDYARTERQRKIIELALEKAKKSDLKTLNDLLGNMLSMVATNLTWQDGLDVIGDIGSYKIADTMGFPTERKEMNFGAKGAIVVPDTLESNVEELHKFLFGDEIYYVSDGVKKLSAKIKSDTSNYSGGSGSGSKKSKSSVKETQSSKEVDESDESGGSSKASSKASRAFETDMYGETIWLDEEFTEPDEGVGYGPGYSSGPSSSNDPLASSSSKQASSQASSSQNQGANSSSSAASSSVQSGPGSNVPTVPAVPGSTASSTTAAANGPGDAIEAPAVPGP